MKVYAFDLETWLVQPGLPTPRMVCGAFANKKRPNGVLMDRAQTLKWFAKKIKDKRIKWVNAFICYDFGVMANELPWTLPHIFAAFREGRVFDILTAEKLIDISKGMLFIDPVNFRTFEAYHQATLTLRYLGEDISASKYGEDAWRLNYAELDGKPLKYWPKEATNYPKKDVADALKIFKRQKHERNIHDLPQQMRKEWSLHLSACHGMRTDPEMVAWLTEKTERENRIARAKLLRTGLIKIRTCTLKKGIREKSAEISQEEIKGAYEAALRRATKAAERYGIQSEEHKVAKGSVRAFSAALKAWALKKPLRYADDQKAIRARVVKAYGGHAPKTDSGKGISISRDTKTESGDELLEIHGKLDSKIESTYLSILQQGTRFPINSKPNPLVATGRTSYRQPNWQNLPRKGGVRECIIPSKGRVIVAADWSQLELCALAQVFINMGIDAELTRMIQDGKDLHSSFGAGLVGEDYEAFVKRVEAQDTEAEDTRQVAKPANFGRWGLLGPVGLVHYSRKNYHVKYCEKTKRLKKCGSKGMVFKYGQGDWEKEIVPTCKVCLKVSEEVCAGFDQIYPEMRKWKQHWYNLCRGEDGGEVEHEVSKRIRGRCRAPEAANAKFQGLAGDLAGEVLWILTEEMYLAEKKSVLLGTRLLAFVHDENLFDAPEKRAARVAARVKEIMTSGKAKKKYTPDIPLKTDPLIMRRWFKGAKPAYSKKGVLKPSWPKDWTWGPDQEQMRKDLAA
jgi:hypothetical protein